MELDVYKTDGKTTGEKLPLPLEVFDIEPNDHAIYQAVRSYMVNNRQGTVSTKNRSHVRGGGKKPWRQKGRGVARAGTTRSPLWVGGGRVFGPLPRDFNFRLPKKLKRLAKLSALTYKARQNDIMVIEDFSFDQAKTKDVANILKNMNLDSTKVLLVTSELDRNLVLAGRNVPNLFVQMAQNLCTYEILNCQKMLIQKSSLDKLKEVCKR